MPCDYLHPISLPPVPTPTSDNHKSYLSFYEIVCFWVIIDLMLVSVIQHRLKISIHFKIITTITLVTICHYTKISHNWLYSPHCTFHTQDSLILEPKVCTSESPSLVFSPFPHPLWQPSVCSLHLCSLSVYWLCFLDFTYRWHHTVFVFVWLDHTDAFQSSPSCSPPPSPFCTVEL